MKKKIFKKIRRLEDNLFSNSKLTYYAVSNHKKKKWSSFKKPILNLNKTEDYIKISNFYSKDLFVKQKTKIFYIKQKNTLNLITALVETRFCRTHSEALFFIRNNKICVNNIKVTNKLFKLNPGDIVSIETKNQKINWINSYFFTKFKNTTTNYSFNIKYEISFSGAFFIICF